MTHHVDVHVDVHVGKRVRHRRWLIGMTQQQLAQQVGIKFQQIQKYETGANRISASRLWDIAEALDVPVSFFFEGLEEAEKETTGKKSVPADLMGDKEALESGALLLCDPGKPAPPLVRTCPRPERRRLIEPGLTLARANRTGSACKRQL